MSHFRRAPDLRSLSARLNLRRWLTPGIGVKRWRLIHRFTLLAWAAGVLHAVIEGTDAGQAWFILLVLLCTGPVLGLLAGRLGLIRPRSQLSRGPVAS